MSSRRYFERVVAAIDFGPSSLGAARWGLAHVAPDRDIVLAHAGALENDRERMHDQDQAGGLVTALLGGLRGFAATLAYAVGRLEVRSGSPSKSLSELLAASAASLLILGRRADANRRSVGEPNVGERLARLTKASVLVVPERITERPRHVVAAIDGSDTDAAVIATASALRAEHGYAMTTLHVLVPSEGAYTRLAPRRSTPESSSIPRALRRASRDLSATGERAVDDRDHAHIGSDDREVDRDAVQFESGDPVREIIAFAQRLGPSILVVGKRGADGAPEYALGSVARELLMTAPAPVLAVDCADGIGTPTPSET
jgi:nucleotide-binding universal stress UspA family protein